MWLPLGAYILSFKYQHPGFPLFLLWIVTWDLEPKVAVDNDLKKPGSIQYVFSENCLQTTGPRPVKSAAFEKMKYKMK